MVSRNDRILQDNDFENKSKGRNLIKNRYRHSYGLSHVIENYYPLNHVSCYRKNSS